VFLSRREKLDLRPVERRGSGVRAQRRDAPRAHARCRVASLERSGNDLFDGLHQLSHFRGLIIRVVAALPPGSIMALLHAPVGSQLFLGDVQCHFVAHVVAGRFDARRSKSQTVKPGGLTKAVSAALSAPPANV